MEQINKHDGAIEDILDSLNGISRAESPPFFYTRLQARLQRQKQSSMMGQIIRFLTQPVFALSTLSLFVLLNMYAITSMVKIKKQSVAGQSNTEASIQSFAQEYDLSVSTLYNDSKNN